MQSVEAKKPGDTLRKVDAQPPHRALAESLADWQEELKAGKVGETLTDLKAALPVVTLAPTPADIKAQTPGKTLSDVVPQASIETQAVAVTEEVKKTIKDTLTYVKPKAPAEKVVDTPCQPFRHLIGLQTHYQRIEAEKISKIWNHGG